MQEEPCNARGAVAQSTTSQSHLMQKRAGIILAPDGKAKRIRSSHTTPLSIPMPVTVSTVSNETPAAAKVQGRWKEPTSEPWKGKLQEAGYRQ
jgi:hypothetical protein